MGFMVNCTLMPDRYNGDREKFLADRREYQRLYQQRNAERIKAIRNCEILPKRRAHTRKRRVD